MCAASISKYPGSVPANNLEKRRQPESERSVSKEPITGGGAGRRLVAFVVRIAVAIDLWLEKRKQIGDLRELNDEPRQVQGIGRFAEW
ncbi:MAG: hypothetical protein QM636_07570 [Rhizobium sp.]